MRSTARAPWVTGAPRAMPAAAARSMNVVRERSWLTGVPSRSERMPGGRPGEPGRPPGSELADVLRSSRGKRHVPDVEHRVLDLHELGVRDHAHLRDVEALDLVRLGGADATLRELVLDGEER